MTRHPFPLAHLVPPDLRPYLLDFHWDIAVLHRLDLPTTQVPLADLAPHLDLPFWRYDDRPFQVTPHQVAADPVRYHEQYQRTMAADLEHPLDVVRRTDGWLTVLDGVHRLLRAELEGRVVVTVRILAWEELDAIAIRR